MAGYFFPYAVLAWYKNHDFATVHLNTTYIISFALID